MNFRADTLTGNIGVTLYQSHDRQTGYKLVHTKNGKIHLKHRGVQRVKTIANAADALRLRRVQTLSWTRATDGTMITTLDGETIINVENHGSRTFGAAYR